MTNLEKNKLKTAKLNWRNLMRKTYGNDWTKRTADRRVNGKRRMNV